MAVNGKAKDLTGQIFQHWSVLKMENSCKHGHRMYLCECVCGKRKILRGSMLLSGNSKSCGCAYPKSTTTTHGKSKSYTYKSWVAMKTRCLNFMDARFPHYGGKGVKICERWVDSFENFYADMGERPYGTTIDRIDSRGNYEPSNCRWATPMEQTLNRSETVWVDYKGERMCFTHLCKKYGVSRAMIKGRLKKGMTLDEAIEMPKQKPRYKITMNGITMKKMEFINYHGMSSTTIGRLMSKGHGLKQAIEICLSNKNIAHDEIIIEQY